MGGNESMQVKDAGRVTAEYAVGTVAAAGFAGMLCTCLWSDPLRATLWDLIRRAFTLAFW